MRLLVPTLCAAALAAAEVASDQAVRAQEGVQRAVASQAERSAAQAGQLADQLRFNRLGDEAQVGTVTRLAADLAALVRSPEPEARTMAYVVERLALARLGDRAALESAAGAQGELVGRLDRLAADASIAAANGADGLRAAIASQRRLREETGTLADQTLGKERAELSATERADLERLARQQRDLAQALREVAKALRAQATTDPDGRDRLEAAAAELAQGGVGGELAKAADALQDNRLAEAQAAQERALDRLAAAEGRLAGAPGDPLVALDQRRQQLAGLQREQQRLLEQTRAEPTTLSRAAADRLAARQQDLARALPEQQQAAVQQAQQAQQALQRLDKAGAEQAMQLAVQALAQAGQQLQTPPAQPAAAPEPVRSASRRGGDWDPALAAADREVLAQVKAESFPARYEQALLQYYRALAAEGAP